MLLDLRLPDLSGFEVCRRMRARSLVPIIVVTAQDDTHDLVASLEAGADDFVTKPVVTKALSARIRALLRRAGYQDADPAAVRRFGDLEVRETEGVVLRHGEPLSLTKTEFLLLCEFANHPNQVLSRDQLLERVWGYEYLGDGRLVDAHIRRLRQKIEADPDRATRLSPCAASATGSRSRDRHRSGPSRSSSRSTVVMSRRVTTPWITPAASATATAPASRSRIEPGHHHDRVVHRHDRHLGVGDLAGPHVGPTLGRYRGQRGGGDHAHVAAVVEHGRPPPVAVEQGGQAVVHGGRGRHGVGVGRHDLAHRQLGQRCEIGLALLALVGLNDQRPITSCAAAAARRAGTTKPG